MNSRLTIAVLLILIILVGIVAYVNRQPKPSAHPTKNQYVFSPHPTSLQRFSYKPASGPELAFNHVGTHWLIVSPIKAHGRDYAIGDLASTLADLKWRYRNRISSGGSHTLAQTGLEKPKAVLTVVNQAGKTFTLNIGSQNATGRLYVHISGSHNPYIDVVKADWLSRLDRPVRKFRNRSLTSIHTRNIAKITLKSAGRIIQIVPHGKGWLLTKPLLAPAATSAITSWISNLQLLTAHRFSSVLASRTGFKNGPLTITVAFKHPHSLPTAGAKKSAAKPHALPAPTPLVINFGIKTDLTGKFYYAQSSYNPGVCVVRNTSFTQMNQSFNKFRDRHLVAGNVATQASKITITRRTGVTGNTPAALTLSKISGKWVCNTSPTQREAADNATVSKLLTDLHSVTAKHFLDTPQNLAALGLSNPLARLKITRAGHIHPIDIAFGTPQKSGLVPVKLAQWPSVYLISSAATGELLPKLTALRSKTVADLTGAKIQHITLRHAGHTIALQNLRGKWMLGTKTPAAASAVNNLLAAWKPLQAKNWFINSRIVSSVPPITLDVTLLDSNKAVPPAAPAVKKPATPAKVQVITQHDVLTLWTMNIPAKSAASKKTATTTQVAAKTQWRAELVQAGDAPKNPAWIFQPKSSLVSAVQKLLKEQK